MGLDSSGKKSLLSGGWRSNAIIALVLLVAINVLNYVDRYVLAAVEPDIRQHVLHEPRAKTAGDEAIERASDHEKQPKAQSAIPGAGVLASGQAISATQESATQPATTSPAQPAAVRNISSAKTKTGWLATAFLLSYMLTAPLFGWMADRMSRWIIIGFGVVVWSLASSASGWTGAVWGSYMALLCTRLFVGVGEAGYGPAAPTIISDQFPVRLRGMILAIFYMAMPVGSALGYIIGGKVAKTMGWEWAFYVVLPPGLLLAFLCFFMKDPPRGQSDHVSAMHRRARLSDYLVIFKTPSYLLDSAGMAAMTFAIGGISYFMPGYLSERLSAVNPHLTAADALEKANTYFGAILCVAGVVATILGGITGDVLRKWFSGSYFIVSGVAIFFSVIFIYLMLQTLSPSSPPINAHPFPLAWVYIFFALFFLFFNTGPANTILANVVHPAVRSSAFAMNIFIIHVLGDVPSPPIFGYIVDHRGWNAAFEVVCWTMLLGSVLWLCGTRFLGEDTRRAPFQLDEQGSDGAAIPVVNAK